MAFEDAYFIEIFPADLKTAGAEAGITADGWTQEVRRVLLKIDQNKVGNMLLRSIKRYGTWVRIEPYWRSASGNWGPEHMKHERNPCNAETIYNTFDYQKGSYPVMPSGRLVRSVMRISPERYSTDSPCFSRFKKQGMVLEDHEIFFTSLCTHLGR